MSDPRSPAEAGGPTDDRLDSWKEIATYFRRDVKTVQRWERREGMPVHRHVHDKIGSVYAYRRELDAWAHSRKSDDPDKPAGAGDRPAIDAPIAAGTERVSRGWLVGVAAAILVTAVAFVAWRIVDRRDDVPLQGAVFRPLTDFSGSELAAAVSRDGRFSAFLSDRDGRMDVWVGVVGTGQFYNLTKGAASDLVNPSLRTLGFSPDGTLVTFWARKFQSTSPSEINIWAIPVLGGAPRPYLEGVAEFDWSPDASRVVYHTPGPGDPIFVRDGTGGTPRQIHSATAGQHAHFPVWSPDQRFIYFVQGTLPDRMDIWRISPDGGTAERITHHDAPVSYPVFVGDRTLLYLAGTAAGDGPWLYSVDVERREPRRVSAGLERYTSLAATADRRRVVATLATRKSALWRVPFGESIDVSGASPLPLTTISGSFPRLGPNYLLYVSSAPEGDTLWKVEGETPNRLWSAPATRVTAAPAISRRGDRIAFVAHDGSGHPSLVVIKADGTDATVVNRTLDFRGAPSWAPDDRSVTVSAAENGVPRLFGVPLGGGAPRQLAGQHALDPVWSPDGSVVAYSGPDVGTTFEVGTVTAAGQSSTASPIRLTRGSRHLCFAADGRSVIVLRGEIGHKDVWLIDLATGRERQLSRFGAGFNVQDFDVSPDGREIVLEQVVEQSDIVLIDRPDRRR